MGTPSATSFRSRWWLKKTSRLWWWRKFASQHGGRVCGGSSQARAQLTLASSGVGSVPHLAVELLNDVGKLNILHFPTRWSAGIRNGWPATVSTELLK